MDFDPALKDFRDEIRVMCYMDSRFRIPARLSEILSVDIFVRKIKRLRNELLRSLRDKKRKTNIN